MKAVFAHVAVLVVALLLALYPAPPGPPANSARDAMYVSNYENVLGTSLELKLLVPSAAQSDHAAAAVLAEIDRESKILSSYDASSEFSRWFRTRNQPVRVSPELFEVLTLFDLWRERSHGALDASAETITRVWQAAAKQTRLPSQSELDAAVATVRQVHWKLDPRHRTATHTSDAPLAMNSFVKSYIVGHAADAALGVPGVRAVVVNIGGDLVVRGAWNEPVSIADPKSDAENADPIAVLLVHNRAIATSGDYRRGVEIAGRHYSHIVDPRTGMPAERIISATVVAANPADAGALATVMSVLPPDEGRSLAALVPGAEYLLVKDDGEKVMSDAWSALEAPPALNAATAAPTASETSVTIRRASFQPPGQAGQAAGEAAEPRSAGHTAERPAGQHPAAPLNAGLWNRAYELTINLELNRIEGDKVMRPFVVVWIEDEDRATVRTISLWYAKLRYLDELHLWYHDESQRPEDEGYQILNSVSSATRPPGKYKVRWDGKDDAGKYVKAGKYIVLLEASREHGTYQLIRQEMDFNGMPKQIQLPGNLEIASASLDYHKIVH